MSVSDISTLFVQYPIIAVYKLFVTHNFCTMANIVRTFPQLAAAAQSYSDQFPPAILFILPFIADNEDVSSDIFGTFTLHRRRGFLAVTEKTC